MNKRPLLIVDDDHAIREVLAEVLTEEGFPVESASHGKEALDIIERTSPALLPLDLNMPVLDGFGLVKALTERGIEVPIVLVSATSNLATHAADLGVVAYIHKPFDILDLLEIVERHYQQA